MLLSNSSLRSRRSALTVVDLLVVGGAVVVVVLLVVVRVVVVVVTETRNQNCYIHTCTRAKDAIGEFFLPPPDEIFFHLHPPVEGPSWG